ncbi:MAG: aminodeoxychorismate/anthranilate synthase component II [Candidatus Pelagibacter sp.]|nr:aminodeoxychorismate/anthranilate synthase component II [Candidatus Pelagibacter sp.]OUV87288.1 MAG: aminodeoxychorismate/anthranilate synthase component II [Pelagibacteraceae bacterium TMED136]|tara:strand:- start:50591 stop:51154 length:564 start_codon:yes stop_codon:yes gene_type:complete
MKIALIDNYDSFTFNIYHYLKNTKCKVEVFRNDKFRMKDLEKFNKIVISPGPGNPDNSGNCLKLIDCYHSKKAILGICLGHQAIAQAFGSKIVKAKKIMHGKISKINIIKKSSIFKNIPKIIRATRYHSLIIENKTLHKSFEITAQTEDNIIMAIQHKKYQLYGIQFHPESYETKQGQKIINNFINL